MDRQRVDAIRAKMESIKPDRWFEGNWDSVAFLLAEVEKLQRHETSVADCMMTLERERASSHEWMKLAYGHRNEIERLRKRLNDYENHIHRQTRLQV